jgi:hypothetical protein
MAEWLRESGWEFEGPTVHDGGDRSLHLGDVGSRGVHADVRPNSSRTRRIIQSNITIGDLLRLRADGSGLMAEIRDPDS